MMNNSIVIDNIRRLLPEVHDGRASESTTPFAGRLAEALGWMSGEARIEQIDVRGIPTQLTRAAIGNQPAMLFVDGEGASDQRLIRIVAFFAYQTSIEWDLVPSSLEET
jgi:hypothetical protein